MVDPKGRKTGYGNVERKDCCLLCVYTSTGVAKNQVADMKHTYCKIVSQAVSLSRACIETHYTANTERPREKVMRGYLLVECAFIRVCISIVTVARNRDNRNTTKNKPPLTGSLS